MVPSLSRVAVLIDAANPGASIALGESEVAAKSLGVELQSFVVRGPEELESTFSASIIEGPLLFSHRALILEIARKNSLPTIGSISGLAVAGGLMEYTTNLVDSVTRAFSFVDRILKGASLKIFRLSSLRSFS
jgi:putative ABC transport system substrate-binding protein